MNALLPQKPGRPSRLSALVLACLASALLAGATASAKAGPTLSVSGSINPNGTSVPRLFTWTSQVGVSGSGWAAGETVHIVLHGPLNSLGVAPTYREIGTQTADGTGAFTGTVTIPYDEGGAYTIPRPGYYEVRGGGLTSGTVFSPNRINICPATYRFDGVGIDWSHERGGREGGVGDIKMVFPHWMATWDETPVGVYGTISRTDFDANNQASFIRYSDFPGDHYGHDVNLMLVPDLDYRWLMGTANYYEIEDDQASREVGRMEVELETLNSGSTNPGSYDHGNIGMPLFPMPTPGDRVYIVGRWILDAGHPDKGDRCEIHPPRLLATIRKHPTVAQLPGGPSGCMTYASQVDVYLSGHQAGAARIFHSLSDVLGSGGRVQDVMTDPSDYYSGDITIPTGLDAEPFASAGGYERTPEFHDINDMDYDFDVPLPPRPAGATSVSAIVTKHSLDGTAVNEVITYKNLDADGMPTAAHIHLPTLGGDNGIYARTIKFAWNAYRPPARHFRVQMDNVLVQDNGDPALMGTGEWFMWADVCGQWINLTNLNFDAFYNTSDGDVLTGLGAAGFDVYCDDDDPLYALTFGYEQDAADYLFGTGFGWDSFWADWNMMETGLYISEPADNDDLGCALLLVDNPSKTNGPGSYDIPAAPWEGTSYYNLRMHVSYIPSPPRLDVNGVPANFGNVCLGSSQDRVISLFNTGEEDLQVNSIKVSGNGFSLLPSPGAPFTVKGGEHVDVTVRFSPTNPTEGDGTIEIQSSDPSQPNVSFDLTGTPIYPIATLSGSLSFGQVPIDDRSVGSVKTLNFYINNAGACPLSIVHVLMKSDSDPAFSMGQPPIFPQTIQPGESLAVPVMFNPGPGAGAKTGTVVVTAANDPTHPFPLIMSADGVGIAPTISASPANTVFDPTVVGCSRSQAITVFNTGPAELIVDSAAIAGAGFTLDPVTLPIRLAPNASTDLTVRFSPPSVARRYDGTLTLNSNDLDTPAKTVAFCGEGAPIGIRVLVKKADGTPYDTVDQITLTSYGVTPNTNTQLKNVALKTISPPESCKTIQYHYETALPATATASKKGSYYNLRVKVGAKFQSLSFTLGSCDFKEIAITLQ